MFEPIYREVAKALKNQALLPTGNATWVQSPHAGPARGQGLRDLVDSPQLTTLFSSGTQLEWLSEGITVDQTPTLRSYLMYEHSVREITPQTFLNRVTKGFLEAQSDEWVGRLYRFLHGQSSLMKVPAIVNKPWVRLEDGSHVLACSGGRSNAFLPSGGTFGFPTVKASVCTNQEALEFLKSLNLTEPDPVDDIIANILPLYHVNSDIEHDINLYRTHPSKRLSPRTQRRFEINALN